MNIPEGFAQVFPYLVVQGAQKYIEFLVAGLGGVEVGRTVTPDGRIANCQVRFGSATIMVGEATAQYPACHVSLYLYVEDAHQSMRRALDAGGTLEMEVGDMPYGDRQGGIRDPGGNLWWISQRLTPEPYHTGG